MNKNTRVARPRSAMVYFDSIPMPMQIPNPHQAQRFSPSKARSRKNNAPAQLATRDASGSANIPKAKKAGRTATNMTLLSADSLS